MRLFSYKASPRNMLVYNAGCAGIVGLVYYFISGPFMPHKNLFTLAGGITWPASALVVAVLWRQPYRRWSLYLTIIGIATLLLQLNNLNYYPPLTHAKLVSLNLLEIALCAWIGKRYISPSGHIDSIPRLVRFLFLLPFGVIILTSLLSTLIVAPNIGPNWWYKWVNTAIGNGFFTLVVLPMLLTQHWSTEKHALQQDTHSYLVSGCATTIIAILLLATSLWHIPIEITAVCLPLILIWSAIYGGMKSTSLTACASIVLLITLMLLGLPPFPCENNLCIRRMQMYLAGLIIAAFFVALAIREFQQITTRLKQALRFESLGLLAGGIVHDFNNILGAVGGYAEMAGEQLPENSPAQAPLRQVAVAIAHGKNITQQMLQSGVKSSVKKRNSRDLRDVIHEAVALTKPLCQPHIVLSYQLPPEPLWVVAETEQLLRVVLNLLRNAMQAARSTVTIQIGYGQNEDPMIIGKTPAGAWAWIDVVDDGMGIPKEHISQLFNPFFSTHHGPGKGGTGLGLAIVASIALEYDGGVGIQSDHSGTRVRFVLSISEPNIKIRNISGDI